MSNDIRKKAVVSKNPQPKHLEHINPWAAGIDIGSRSHFVAVPEGCDEKAVREFQSFTSGLYELADWLKHCGIQTVAMESTGIYWIPLYEVLEERGFEVKLVDARQVKNVSGRKTDVLDCQWLQQLHTYGLLNAAFRPADDICALRVYIRQRKMLVEAASKQLQHMQKALMQMNVQLHHVVTDISGETGMKIIRSILEGKRAPNELARHRDPRCKQSLSTIEAALVGNYREEHLFALRQAHELYEVYQQKIANCDREIEKKLLEFKTVASAQSPLKSLKKNSKGAPSFDVETHLYQLTGVNLLKVPGINSLTALTLIGEIGCDMTRWKTAKQFTSWLGLCPGNKVSGGKRLGGKTKPTANRAAAALRMAASTLSRNSTSLGAYLRRLKSRLGPAKAITATAHKIAKIVYNMLRRGVGYEEVGEAYYEEHYRGRVLKNLKRKAAELGFELVEKEPAAI